MQLRTTSIGAAYAEAKQVCRLCAITVVTPSVRSNVDFPDMFDPVTSMPAPGRSSTELGTAVGDQRVNRLRHRHRSTPGE